MFLVTTVGAVTSCTVTVAEALAELPLLSVTVRVTVLAPTLVQSKLYGLTTRLATEQLSLEPLSTWAAVMLTWPLASRFTSMFRVRTVGAVTSCTVTVAEVLAELPLLSVTVRVTVLAPSLVQSKLDGLTTRLVMPQLSLEPLSTWAAVTLTWPLASRFTSMFRVRTVGRVASCTVTVAEALAELPLLSVTVRVTVLGPSLVQSKLDGLTTRLVMPQLSLEPLSTWAAVMLTWPLAPRFTSMFCARTVGAVTSCTV